MKAHSTLVTWVLVASASMLGVQNKYNQKTTKVSRSRIKGPVNPAGSKLARMAAEQRLTLRK